MRFAVWIFGILIAVEGVLLIVKPQLYNKIAVYLAKSKFTRLAPFLKTIIGIFLLVAVTSCERKVIVLIMGLLAAIVGASMQGMEKEKLKTMYEWCSVRPPIMVRLMGVATIAVAALLLYAAGIPQ
jgi:drug/metabolite transporter (DMT)-like permease